jgi:hypothetical protein
MNTRTCAVNSCGVRPVEQASKGNGDAFEPNCRDRRPISTQQGGELFSLTAGAVFSDVAAKRVEEEVQLPVTWPFAPQRAVVVEEGDPVDRRQFLYCVEEAHERVPDRTGSPRRQ